MTIFEFMGTLLTYEECRKIVDNNDDIKFYETKHRVGGYDVSIFNYRLAWIDDFIKPLDDSDINAHEMRGITFIFNKDGSLYDRFLMLPKFWNVNQIEESLMSRVSKFNVKSVMGKQDGSLASFIKLPNGEVYGRSKASFSSDQAIRITYLYNTNSSVKELVDWGFDNNITLIFEYVSPYNKVVLDYSDEELILLRARDDKGEFLDVRDFNTFGVRITDFYDLTLEQISKLVHVIEGEEGWVIEFDNGYTVKWKTDWYFERHELFTEKLNRENDIIKLILDNKIDDILSQLSDNEVDKGKREVIDIIMNIINKEFTDISNGVRNLLDDYNGSRKSFAKKYNKHFLFPICMSILDGNDEFEIIKDIILKDTFRLEKSRMWLKERGYDKML